MGEKRKIKIRFFFTVFLAKPSFLVFFFWGFEVMGVLGVRHCL